MDLFSDASVNYHKKGDLYPSVPFITTGFQSAVLLITVKIFGFRLETCSEIIPQTGICLHAECRLMRNNTVKKRILNFLRNRDPSILAAEDRLHQRSEY